MNIEVPEIKNTRVRNFKMAKIMMGAQEHWIVNAPAEKCGCVGAHDCSAPNVVGRKKVEPGF